MSGGDPSLPSLTSLTTEQIQKYLEENKQLILAIMEGQNLGNSSDIAQCQARLQHNLTFLAKLADTQPQAQIQSQLPSQAVVQQGQGTQHPHIAMSQPQPDLSTLPFNMKDQKQVQHHLTMSLQQPDVSTSKLPVQMNEQQQEQQQPAFFQQQQLMQGQMNWFPAGSNSGINQASQARLGVNLSGKQESNPTGLEVGGSLGKSPLSRNSGNTRP
ncbi:GRF1-interacting factor 2-like [Senna tora]|uniref:GRF1-interacting factor 2-like n=1 Tax=Senna tora TaxID=362788 RepID=A0A834TYQ0_9FABA|nr:GRF1-interacting factor 2-like [Senna tora]